MKRTMIIMIAMVLCISVAFAQEVGTGTQDVSDADVTSGSGGSSDTGIAVNTSNITQTTRDSNETKSVPIGDGPKDREYNSSRNSLSNVTAIEDSSAKNNPKSDDGIYGASEKEVAVTDSQKSNRSKYNEEDDNVTKLRGLANAITRVQNNETRAHLQDVFERIEAKQLAQLANLTDVKFEVEEKTNKTTVTGVGKAKFLGLFSVAKRYAYGIDNNGNIEKKAKFFDFLFKKQDPVAN